jgi:hypothetical protein
MLFGPRFSRVHVRARVASLQLLRFAAARQSSSGGWIASLVRGDEGQGDLTT